MLYGAAIQAYDGLDVTGACKGLSVKEGTNCKQGTVTMDVARPVSSWTTPRSPRASRIFLSIQSKGIGHARDALCGAPGRPETSFTVASTVASDNSVVAYEIIEPG